jgi:ATP-dependent helicase/DNAse subunit B
MYLKNPMEFYYKYVLGLKEEDDLLDEPEARQVGTFVHELLEHAFKPFVGKKAEINAKFRQHFQQDFEKKFSDTFGRSMKSDSFLLKSVMIERLNRFLDNEQFNEERQIEKILYLEKRFDETIALPFGNIKFGYIVDRVDQLSDGTIMIVDYKTGGIDQMPKAFDQIASLKLSRELIRDTVKSFQLPLYLHYLDKQFPGQPVNAALYNLRTLELKRFLDPSLTQTREVVSQAYLRALDFVVSEILNPDVDFVEDL